jgi:creatinine amidohydrolase
MREMMASMPWPEYQQRVRDGAVVFLPVGATEQHGYHMTLSTDTVLPLAVSRMVARNIGGIVAPAVPYGYKSQPRSGGGNHYVGTTSLSASTLIGVIKDLLLEFARHGCRRLVVMNGHYENAMFEVEGIDLALAELRLQGITDFKVLKIDYYEFITRETTNFVFPEGFPGWALEHAGIFETSLMLHLHPELVNVAAIPDEAAAVFPPYDVYPTDLGPIPPSGMLSPAHTATAEKGARLAAEYDERITAAVRREFCI